MGNTGVEGRLDAIVEFCVEDGWQLREEVLHIFGHVVERITIVDLHCIGRTFVDDSALLISAALVGVDQTVGEFLQHRCQIIQAAGLCQRQVIISGIIWFLRVVEYGIPAVDIGIDEVGERRPCVLSISQVINNGFKGTTGSPHDIGGAGNVVGHILYLVEELQVVHQTEVEHDTLGVYTGISHRPGEALGRETLMVISVVVDQSALPC